MRGREGTSNLPKEIERKRLMAKRKIPDAESVADWVNWLVGWAAGQLNPNIIPRRFTWLDRGRIMGNLVFAPCGSKVNKLTTRLVRITPYDRFTYLLFNVQSNWSPDGVLF